ncbi:hypothetical protein [Cohnella nanjingensis]|uniref:Uncharacterized protein n=1 Tax=Cohnella nanjingensis TaxID=1387779 RepID=A0A7X0RXB7_9BACL|nr:hypothetical protein [Cohnella nanjingensis]MBB6675387.1 hypothetical protein [Cohnella nanjingensis]
MKTLDMQRLQASFTSQDQAEEAIRKLTALRGNRFRMAREGAGADFGSGVVDANAQMNAMANSLLYGASEPELGDELGRSAVLESEAAFSLSADVPASAIEQARQVVAQAGGTVV